jgi:hypothetical protein
MRDFPAEGRIASGFRCAKVRMFESGTKMPVCRHIARVFLGLAALLPAGAALAQGLEIRILFDQTFDRVKPTARTTTTHYDIDVSLDRSGSVTHREQKTNASGETIQTIDKDLRLGPGNRYEWRVASANTLTNIYRYETFHRDILVTVHGSDCQVKIDYVLNAGQSEFHYLREPSHKPAVASAVRAEKASCTAVEKKSP